MPLVCLGLAVAAEALARRDATLDGDAATPNPGTGRGTHAPDPDAARPGDPWRIGRGAVIGLALGAATLVHPVIGFFAIATVGIAGLVRPRALAAAAFVATLTAGLIALPQLATMIGISLPTIALGIWLPVAIAAGIAVGRAVDRSQAAREALERLAEIGRLVLIVAAVAALAVAFAVSLLNLDRVPDAVLAGADLVMESERAAAPRGRRGRRARQPRRTLTDRARRAGRRRRGRGADPVLPGDLGFLGDALRFEVPKTVHYWLSAIAAAGAAPALAHLWATVRLPGPRAFSPSRRSWSSPRCPSAPFRAVRRRSTSASIAGRRRSRSTCSIAESGFWVGFPDSRTVVDGPRQELLDALRVEIDGGRLRHDTPCSTSARPSSSGSDAARRLRRGHRDVVSLDPEVSHQTVGGRLYGLADLPGFLDRRLFPVPRRSSPTGSPRAVGVRAAGYAEVFENGQGTDLPASEPPGNDRRRAVVRTGDGGSEHRRAEHPDAQWTATDPRDTNPTHPRRRAPTPGRPPRSYGPLGSYA